MHETPKHSELKLRQQLEWLSSRFTLIDFDAFARLWEDCRVDPESFAKFRKPPLLLTFDDGRLSNYEVAAPLLESFGTRGLYFVVPEFVKCSPKQARDFYYSRIDIRQPPVILPEEETISMTADQIGDLARRGHAIGNHTYSHANLSKLSDIELHREIAESAAQISQWIGKPVDAFAWTFSWDAITPRAWQIIRDNHRFCFAPCPGSVVLAEDRERLIWRTEVEVEYSEADYRFMYSGMADWPWRRRRERLKQWLDAASEP